MLPVHTMPTEAAGDSYTLMRSASKSMTRSTLPVSIDSSRRRSGIAPRRHHMHFAYDESGSRGTYVCDCTASMRQAYCDGPKGGSVSHSSDSHFPARLAVTRRLHV